MFRTYAQIVCLVLGFMGTSVFFGLMMQFDDMTISTRTAYKGLVLLGLGFSGLIAAVLAQKK
jgi:hypothetical protein